MIAPDVKTAIRRLRALVDGAGAHRAVHRRGHLDRMRHPGFPFARAASGPRCGRSTFRISSPARRRATNPGGGASPWRSSSAAPSPGRGHQALASPLSRRQVARRGDSKHRQPAPSLWHCCRTRRRAARQHDLRDLPRLRGALRIALGQAALRARAAARPSCPSCGGHIKTATVSFGQAMPEEAMRRAEELTLLCRSFHRDRFLAGGLAGGGLSADGEAQRRAVS